jgi:hypothetical protein
MAIYYGLELYCTAHLDLTLLTMAIFTQALEKNDPLAAVLDMPRCKAVRGPKPGLHSPNPNPNPDPDH